MDNLQSTYDRGPVRAIWSYRELVISIMFFVLGTAALLIATVGATTDLFPSLLNTNTWQSWEISGVLAGLGAPLLAIAVYQMLPSTRLSQIALTVGISLCLAGVYLFFIHFPNQWVGDPVDKSFQVVAIYGLGAIITLGQLIFAVMKTKKRNPGGTVELTVTVEGEERVIEVEREKIESQSIFGGVASFSDRFRYGDDIKTQTAKKRKEELQKSD